MSPPKIQELIIACLHYEVVRFCLVRCTAKITAHGAAQLLYGYTTGSPVHRIGVDGVEEARRGLLCTTKSPERKLLLFVVSFSRITRELL